MVARSILILLTSILLVSPAYAAIGSITEFKGGGQIKRSASTLIASRGLGIEKMDTVSTSSSGRFGITFSDQTKVNITENSKLVIDDFVYDGGASSKGKLGMKVALGTVRYASGAIAHGNPSAVNIRTPTSTIGVRGTDFLMSVDEVGRTMVILLPSCVNNDGIQIGTDCVTGEIEVATSAGTVTMNQPYQATLVESATVPPTTPTSLNLADKPLNNTLQLTTVSDSKGDNFVLNARKELLKRLNPSAAKADENSEPDVGTTDDVKEIAVALRPVATQQQLLEVYVKNNPSTPLTDTIYTVVSPIFNKKQVQTGWAISILSDAKLQSADVYLPLDTKTQVTVAQDGTIDSFNFADHHWPTSGTGRPQGNITIIQKSGSQ
jgi:hypothetical protein